MTHTTLQDHRSRALSGRLWHWLVALRRRRMTVARLDTLSDHMLRDIGVERDEIDRVAVSTMHEAMRYSG